MAEATLATGAIDLEAVRASRRWLAGRLVIYGILAVFAVVYLGPLAIVVVNPFRDQEEIVRNGLIALPGSLHGDAWSTAWGSYCIGGSCEGMRRYFFDALWMTVPATIISTAFGAVNGY